MHYADEAVGFSFDLLDGWNYATHILNPSFPGTRYFTSDYGLICLMAGEVQDNLVERAPRRIAFEGFLQQEGFTDILIRDDLLLGGERNTIFAEYKNVGRTECQISCVRDNLQYQIRYKGSLDDSLVRKSVDTLLRSFQFPTLNQAVRFMLTIRPLTPKEQLIMDALKSGNSEEARDILSRHGYPASVIRPGYTIHNLEDMPRRSNIEQRRKWWQFWKQS